MQRVQGRDASPGSQIVVRGKHNTGAKQCQCLDCFDIGVQLLGPLTQLLRYIWELPIIAISQMHGHAIESGMILGLTCDLAVAADDAGFLWRPFGGAGMLWHPWPWTIGMRKTKEILLMGDYITSKEAAEMEMINKSVPPAELEDEVMRMARNVARRPREFNVLVNSPRRCV
ncbi:MAG: hypothetical protein HY675_06515 [Chloroflexi bacterium]|nr:hypothetical protein [Chloroflexota bacterium]